MLTTFAFQSGVCGICCFILLWKKEYLMYGVSSTSYFSIFFYYSIIVSGGGVGEI